MRSVSIDYSKQLIDKTLKEFFEARHAEAKRLDPSYGQLWKAIEKTCLAGGKRLRPYMCFLTYQAFGGKRITDVIDVAIAQELLHMSLVIHDDIIDRDYVRHGVDNIAGQYLKIYDSVAEKNSVKEHSANSAALLAGDLLLTYAHAMINESKLNSIARRAVSNQLQRSIFTVGGGQLMDVESAFADWRHVDPLKTALYKTAAYSFVGPLTSGAMAAGASNRVIKSLERFGNNLGIAFQLTDDVLDVFGEAAVTGKPNASDIKEGKKTCLLVTTYKKAGPEQRKFLEKTLSGEAISDNQVEKIKIIMQASGAKAKVEALAESYIANASEELKALNLESNHQKAFQAFAESVAGRSR